MKKRGQNSKCLIKNGIEVLDRSLNLRPLGEKYRKVVLWKKTGNIANLELHFFLLLTLENRFRRSRRRKCRRHND